VRSIDDLSVLARAPVDERLLPLIEPGATRYGRLVLPAMVPDESGENSVTHLIALADPHD
jgi:hypothetical protein